MKTGVSGSRAVRWYWIVVGLLMTAAAAALASLLHWGQAIEAAEAVYRTQGAADADCASGARPGSAGRHRLRSPEGVPYVVVTPVNYRPRQAHPLLVVYAPAGFSAGLSERFAGLTHAATTAGSSTAAGAWSASTVSPSAPAIRSAAGSTTPAGPPRSSSQLGSAPSHPSSWGCVVLWALARQRSLTTYARL